MNTNVLDDARENDIQRAERENTNKVLLETKVAETIDTAALKNVQNSIENERDRLAPYIQQTKSMEKDFMVTGDGLNYRGNKIFNFYFRLLDVVLVQSGDIAGNCDGYLMKVEVTVYHGGSSDKHILDNISKDFLSSPKVLCKVPFAGSFGLSKSGMSEMLYKYVNFLLSEYTGRADIVFRSTGWKQISGQMVYVDGEKVLGDADIKARAMSKLYIRNRVNELNLYQCFCDMCRAMRDTAQMRVFLLYVLSSFIFSLFLEANIPFKHCLGLIGPRATKKTSLALCFSQIENKKTPKFNFLATESGIQAHFQDYHDSCILIDDLAPSPSPVKKRESERKLEMLLRLFGDAGERVINKNFLDEKAQKIDYSVKGGAIITGEYFHSSNIVESSVARAIILELTPDSVDLEKLSYYQNHPELLESFVYRFLVYIGENWQKNKQNAVEVMEEYRKKYQRHFSNARYAEYMGQHMATSSLLAGMFLYRREISAEQAKQFCEESERAIGQVLLRNDENMKARAPINTVLLSINYMIETQRCIRWGEPLPLQEACVILGQNTVYLRQKDLPDIVKEYCTKTGEVYVPMGCKELGKLLVQEGLCEVFNEGGRVRPSKKYSKDYGNTRLMEIPLDKIKDTLGILGDD